MTTYERATSWSHRTQLSAESDSTHLVDSQSPGVTRMNRTMDHCQRRGTVGAGTGMQSSVGEDILQQHQGTASSKRRSYSTSVAAFAHPDLPRQVSRPEYGHISYGSCVGDSIPPVFVARCRSANPSRRPSDSFMQSLRRAPSSGLLASMVESVGIVPPRTTLHRGESSEAIDRGSLDVLEEQHVVDETEYLPPPVHTGRTSTWVAGWSVTNLIQGIGIMGLPYACVGAGWVAVVIIIFVGMICCFAGKLIGESLYDPQTVVTKEDNGNEKEVTVWVRKRQTYACIAADLWPRYGRGLVGTIVVTELLGALVLYLILLGGSAVAVLNHLGVKCISLPACIALFGTFSYPLLLWPQMRAVAWMSVVALVGLLISVISVLVYCAMQAADMYIDVASLLQPRPPLLPVSLCIVIFSYCAHAILPGIEGSMRRPELYPRMLDVTFSVSAIVKLVFGAIGAMVFGDAICQSVTDNMTRWPGLALSAHVAVGANAFFSIPMVTFIIGEQMDRLASEQWQFPQAGSIFCVGLYPLWVIASRGCVLAIGLLIGLLVPHFALIMGLIGAFTGTMLCFILPAAFHLKLFWARLSRFAIAMRLLMAAFGVVAGTFGFIFSAIEIHRVFNEDSR